MTESTDLSPPEREEFLRTAWLSHDARWYAAAVEELGPAIANRLNRRAIRAAAAVEARRLHRAIGMAPIDSVSSFLKFAEFGRDLVVGDKVELATEELDEHTYRATVTRCFAADQITRAGLTGTYECGIFDRIQGWHEGLGVPLTGDVPTTLCLLANGEACTRTLTIAEPTLQNTSSDSTLSTTKD